MAVDWIWERRRREEEYNHQMSQDELQQPGQVQWTPAPEEKSEIAVQFFTAPYPCQNGQLDHGEHHALGGIGACSSVHWQPDRATCYWPPPLSGDGGGGSGSGSSGTGEGGYIGERCYYVGEPDVPIGLNLLVGDNDGAGVVLRDAAPQAKRRTQAGHGGDLGRQKKKARVSDKRNQESMQSGSCSDNESNCSQVNRRKVDRVAGGGNGKVPARRRSATIAQSLYARRRRERINGRLRILQKLVPNGTKVDISTMLEEAVHYVKFLQLQIKVEVQIVCHDQMLSSDELWMYAPIVYNGMDLGIDLNISPPR
uniref:BHLH domain-containing protein n=1 Tax=Oryza glaberrima TaxID=4538 RepID=I1PFS6_ORYGL